MYCRLIPYLFTLAFILFPSSIYAQQKDNQNVIAQMNYCISSLTNIIHNKSMSVLEHESDQIVNNLTMEQSIGLADIKDFRVELLDAISKFEITDEERQLMKRINSIKRDNMKWTALSNALSPTMFITGSGIGPGSVVQMGFQVLTAAARSAVEYNQVQGEATIEELQAMWNLRKEDLQTINDLRKTALDITFNLYNKYNLTEEDRLTEATANSFCDYVNEKNANRRIRLLEENRSLYQRFPDYYYYLGMAYLDANNYTKAKENFQNYIQLYSKAPILRHDEKIGCISLARLTHEKGLADAEKIDLINAALKNMPHNNAAKLQCALIFIYELKNTNKGLSLILSGLDDPESTDLNIMYMAAAKLMPLFSINSPLLKSINSYFQSSNLGIGTYLLWSINYQNNLWQIISRNIKFDNITKRKWLVFTKFNPKFEIILPERLQINDKDVSIFLENHGQNKVDIEELSVKDKSLINDEDIQDIDCFKSNKDLKYLFVDIADSGQGYFLKSNIDIWKIKNEEWPRMSEFVLSEDDIDDIIDFCKDHMSNTHNNIYQCEEIDTDYAIVDSIYTLSIKYKGKMLPIGGSKVRFKGHKLTYKPHHSPLQEGQYIKIIFNNSGITLLYKYDSNNKTLEPYLYSYNSKKYFANNQYKKEYETKVIFKKQDKAPWYKRLWAKIVAIFR